MFSTGNVRMPRFRISLRMALLISVPLSFVVSCTTVEDPAGGYRKLDPAIMMEAPEPDSGRAASYDPAVVAQGKYMVGLLGCATCHIDGALIGKPDLARGLAGSTVGIAYSDPLRHKYPGVVYPSNLTPDTETGIGLWTDEQITQNIRTGVDKHGRSQLSVMPWPAYSRISDEDAAAIVAYLRSLAPVKHLVPENVRPGQKAISPFVHFGVYQSRQQ